MLLADAHSAALAGLRAALADDGFRLLAEVGDAEALVSEALLRRPDVCLVDADLPGGAIAATAQLTAQLPRSAVVVMARHRGDAPMLDAVRAGAAGYLLKDMDPERLRFAIRGVTEGEAALPRKLVTRLMEEFRDRERGRSLRSSTGDDVRLSPREWASIELLASGASTHQIASTLTISEVTVRRHISSAVAKLGVAGRDEAVAALNAARRG